MIHSAQVDHKLTPCPHPQTHFPPPHAGQMNAALPGCEHMGDLKARLVGWAGQLAATQGLEVREFVIDVFI